MNEELLRKLLHDICEDCAPAEEMTERLLQSIMEYLKTVKMIE